MSQDINYALISALYNSKTGGLYSDVYFPIIKYTIVQLFNQNESIGSSKYFKAQDVQDFIWDKFKIKIPIIVLTKSLQKIDNTQKGFVELSLMENGNSFQIRGVWDSHEFDELSGREEQFNEGLKHIEEDYKLFLEQNGTFDDGVSYLQFIADNTQEVLGYFQNSDTKVIDEKYTTIIFFLEYLHKTPSKKDEFFIADQLFWASIIAGYLKSEKLPVTEAEEGSVKEYFLDTSIVMGIMELSSKQKEEYTAELREIIKASGGIMRVHPMTLEEIKTILTSVESSSLPEPGTDIAEAWENHKLTINRLAKIRLTLEAIMDKLDIQVFPQMGSKECRQLVKSFQGKKIVAELAAERSKSYSQDNFREIHDLFMDNYIKERRKDKKDSDDIVFVTANRDLVTFTKRMHPGQCYMMSTGRVILELWMHNVKPSEISSYALTETMARCLDQHNIRVRNKIMEVSKFYNENKGNFDAQVYQDFVKKLYQRAKNVIMTVETNPDNQDEVCELTAQRILDAVRADQEYYEKKIHEKEEENATLTNKLNDESQSKESLAKKNEENRAIIESLENKNNALEEQVLKTNEQLGLTEKLASKEKKAREYAEGKISLYKRRDDLNIKIESLKKEIVPLEVKRENSFHNLKPYIMRWSGVLIILAIVIMIFYSIKNTQYWMIPIGTIPMALAIFLMGRANTLLDRTEERRMKAYEDWESKDKNKKYTTLSSSLKNLKEELEEIEKKLNQ